MQRWRNMSSSRLIRLRIIHITMMRSARPWTPYNVRLLDYTFFRNFEQQSTNLFSLRPCKKPGDPHLVDIRALLFKTDGSNIYKISSKDEYIILSQRRNYDTNSVISPLYTLAILITERKYNHPQNMKFKLDKKKQLHSNFR